MPIPHGGPSNYDRDLFCDRPPILRSILDWIDNPQKSCFCLVGPPGTGKSWLLAHLQDELANPQETIPIFLLNNLLGYFLLDSSKPITESPKLAVNVLRDWVRNCYAQAARLYGPTIPDFVHLNHPAASISNLATSLSSIPGNHCKALLLVDGFDELPIDPLYMYQDILVDNVIKRFLSNNFGSKNILVLFTQRTKIDRYPLIISADRVVKDITDPAFANETVDIWSQFQKVHQNAFGGIPQVSKAQCTIWRRKLKHYRWNNLFVNHYLFACGLNRAGNLQSPVTADELKTCICDLLERPRPTGATAFPKLQPVEFDILVEIARLKDSFIREELAPVVDHCTPGSNFSLYNHPSIDRFFSVYGILYSDPAISGRVCLDPCVRALLLDYRLHHSRASKPLP
jgi:hypothetical protein